MCGTGSDNILQLEDGGRRVGQVVGGGGGIYRPLSICVGTNNSTLVVSMWFNSSIKVFDLK